MLVQQLLSTIIIRTCQVILGLFSYYASLKKIQEKYFPIIFIFIVKRTAATIKWQISSFKTKAVLCPYRKRTKAGCCDGFRAYHCDRDG